MKKTELQIFIDNFSHVWSHDNCLLRGQLPEFICSGHKYLYKRTLFSEGTTEVFRHILAEDTKKLIAVLKFEIPRAYHEKNWDGLLAILFRLNKEKHKKL